MKAGFLRRQLGRRPRKLIIAGAIFAVLFSPSLYLLFLVLTRGNTGRPPLQMVLVFCAVEALSLAFIVWGVVALRRLARHPDLLALGRYGPPAEVAAAIDAELADPQQVVRIGRVLRSFSVVVAPEKGEVAGELLFTPSWLVCVTGEDGSRLHALRLADLVWVYRRPSAPLQVALGWEPTGQVVLCDRHGFELTVPGTEQGLARVMAEVIARVPWALTRFDEQTEKSWRDQREQVIAEADRRRQETPATDNNR
jgi:hypothetical protein